MKYPRNFCPVISNSGVFSMHFHMLLYFVLVSSYHSYVQLYCVCVFFIFLYSLPYGAKEKLPHYQSLLSPVNIFIGRGSSRYEKLS